jgi:hypothetical protein
MYSRKGKFRTEENDNDVESLFRPDQYAISNQRAEIQELNKLITYMSKKYGISDIWGRTYKSKPQEISIVLSDGEIKNIADKQHPVVQVLEANGIKQIQEQGEYSHLKYAVFTFDSSKCKDILKTIESLNPTANELKQLHDNAMRSKVLC